MTRPKYAKRQGRPPGASTKYWTDQERGWVETALNSLLLMMPYRNKTAIARMAIRMAGGEFEDYRGADAD